MDAILEETFRGMNLNDYEKKFLADKITYSTAIALLLVSSGDEYNMELASKVGDFLNKEPIKNYINFYEAYLILYRSGEPLLAQKSRDIAEFEKSRVDGIQTRFMDYSLFESGIRFYKETFFDEENNSDKEEKSVYVLELNNNSVKIGISCNPQDRIRQISSQSGLTVTRRYFTRKIQNAQKIESELHRHFKENRLNGEYFSINYEEALAELLRRTKTQSDHT